jgi:hypothetical protein
MKLDWRKLGRHLRISALDAHGGELPDVHVAYSFLRDNPECFIDQDVLDTMNAAWPGENLTMADVKIGNVTWPGDMPMKPPVELIEAYYSDPQAELQ